jgi:hypothetical protein
MSRSIAWTKVGWGALLVAAIAAPEAFHAVRASPQPLPVPFAAASSAAKPFAAVCKANEVADSRPDPAWVGASFAHDNCLAPPMPKALDGATAKREEIVAAMVAVKRYAALSDAYQRCISDFVAARKAQAGKPAAGPLMVIEAHRIFVSQVNKTKAATQVKVAINAFNEYGSECPDQ